jgi:ATP-dependent helicase YprA (DUF1998 family)
MDVFSLRGQLIGDYSRFARSFTTIRADDLRGGVDASYASGRYWPDPLIQINPHYQAGRPTSVLAAVGELQALTARHFDIDLYRHQEQSIACGANGDSFVVTTGTGSGKSLCFFLPIVDRVLRAKTKDSNPSYKGAIVIYPMNALANSQREELIKYLGEDGPVTFARYTGQEDGDERERIKRNPPDILLTNFMMLELLMTRQDELDRQVIANCEGLQFLVLDELHTYRGRQGADVAMLVRRVRERLAPDGLQCIGTSATMASGGTAMEDAEPHRWRRSRPRCSRRSISGVQHRHRRPGPRHRSGPGPPEIGELAAVRTAAIESQDIRPDSIRDAALRVQPAGESGWRRKLGSHSRRGGRQVGPRQAGHCG